MLIDCYFDIDNTSDSDSSLRPLPSPLKIFNLLGFLVLDTNMLLILFERKILETKCHIWPAAVPHLRAAVPQLRVAVPPLDLDRAALKDTYLHCHISLLQCHISHCSAYCSAQALQ
eukprot:scaffold168633_cov39-Cyclotella_meneghiniana.AAC.1